MAANFLFLTMLFLGSYLVIKKDKRGWQRSKTKFLKMMSKARKMGNQPIFYGKSIKKRKEILYKKEIYKLAVFLENMQNLYEKEPRGASFMMEELSNTSALMGDGLKKMMEKLNVNRKEEALFEFMEYGKTKDAQEFGKLLLDLDKINPSELQMSIVTLKDRLREELITIKAEKNEVISDLIYVPAIFNVVVIMINFVYIAYFAQQQDFFMELMNNG